MAESNQGMTRRELLRKGAALGGAVAWMTPVVQTVGMGRAFAQTGTPEGPDISYIAMHVACGEDIYTVKWEADTGSWDPEPGNFPGCAFEVSGSKADGGTLEISVSSVGEGCYSISFGNCRFIDGVAKGGRSTCTAFTDPGKVCL